MMIRIFQNISVRQKLVRIIIIVSGVSLLLAGGIYITFNLMTYKRFVVLNRMITAQIVGSNSTAALVFNDPKVAEDNLASLRAQPRIIAAALYTKEGHIFASYLRGEKDIAELPSLPGTPGASFQQGRFNLFQEVMFRGEKVGTIYIQSDTQDLSALVYQYSLLTITVFMVMMIVVYFLAGKFQRLVSNPIVHLAEVARKVATEKNYRVRAVKYGEDEIGHLTDVFNEMLAGIQERNEAIHRLNVGLEQRVVERTKELEASLKELDSFAYSVSHDLKAPLRGIGQVVNWLHDDFIDKLNDEQKENMNLMKARVGRMNDLIDGILRYSRLGRKGEVKEQVNLQKLVADVIDSLAAPKEIKVEIEGTLPTLSCVLIQIEQVCQNLISNAIRYVDKKNGKIKIGCRDTNFEWVFFVKDNGPGIAKEHFEKIFQIFQTLKPRDEVESTGIGLSIVKKVVELHQGRVWLESEVGKGSTFFFSLPKEVTTRKGEHYEHS